MNYVDRIIKTISYLPPFPATVAKALMILRDPAADIDEVAEVIKFDQSIASNLLRLCNSSYVGLRRPITSVREAVVFVGMNHLKRILVMTGTKPYFDKKRPGYETAAGELWKHSLATTIVASKFEAFIPGAESDAVFISALLHDIGKLVLSEFVVSEHARILTTVNEQKISFLEAERRVFGVDHAEVGSRVLSFWRFPDDIVGTVGSHHAPLKDDDTPMLDIIRLADIVAITMGYGTTVDGLAYRGFSDICHRRSISRDTIDSVTSSTIEELKRVESSFGFQGGQ